MRKIKANLIEILWEIDEGLFDQEITLDGEPKTYGGYLGDQPDQQFSDLLSDRLMCMEGDLADTVRQ